MKLTTEQKYTIAALPPIDLDKYPAISRLKAELEAARERKRAYKEPIKAELDQLRKQRDELQAAAEARGTTGDDILGEMVAERRLEQLDSAIEATVARYKDDHELEEAIREASRHYHAYKATREDAIIRLTKYMTPGDVAGLYVGRWYETIVGLWETVHETYAACGQDLRFLAFTSTPIDEQSQ